MILAGSSNSRIRSALTASVAVCVADRDPGDSGDLSDALVSPNLDFAVAAAAERSPVSEARRRFCFRATDQISARANRSSPARPGDDAAHPATVFSAVRARCQFCFRATEQISRRANRSLPARPAGVLELPAADDFAIAARRSFCFRAKGLIFVPANLVSGARLAGDVALPVAGVVASEAHFQVCFAAADSRCAHATARVAVSAGADWMRRATVCRVPRIADD